MGLQDSPFVKDGRQVWYRGRQGWDNVTDDGAAPQGEQRGAVSAVGSVPEARQGDGVGHDVGVEVKAIPRAPQEGVSGW